MAKEKETAPTGGAVIKVADMLEINVAGFSKIVVTGNQQLFDGMLSLEERLEPLFGAEPYQREIYPDLFVAGFTEQVDNYIFRLKAAYEELRSRTQKELILIQRVFNNWGWPAALGKPPVDNWEELPHYRRPDMPEDTVTRADYIKPYMDACLVLGVRYGDTLR